MFSLLQRLRLRFLRGITKASIETENEFHTKNRKITRRKGKWAVNYSLTEGMKGRWKMLKKLYKKKEFIKIIKNYKKTVSCKEEVCEIKGS